MQTIANDVAQKKTKVWEKQKKKSKGKSSKKAKKAAKPVKRQTAVQAHSAGDTNKEGGEEHSTNSTPKKVFIILLDGLIPMSTTLPLQLNT